MQIQAVKGTRDFYPEAYAPLRRVFDTWRAVSERHGFAEYEGPTLEMLDLYREKSGDELVGQLYRLTDSGGRELALRPEMTPTLARMVAARLSTLAKPIKWFCIPRLFRGENVQRGRLREFFQWNVDVIGSADVIADAECILVGVEALRELGLAAEDFVVHISNRRLLSEILSMAGIGEESHGTAFALIDKSGKASEAELSEKWNGLFGGRLAFARLREMLGVADLAALRGALEGLGPRCEAMEAALAETERLLGIIQDFGIIDFCKLDLSIVRGLAYYTGPVFEFYDRAHSERAICGGGRYDDLLGKLGKSKEPAVGFGMGDVVLALMLEERGLLTVPRQGSRVLVAEAAEGLRPVLYRVVAALRRGGVETEFNYGPQALGKQLRAADKRGISKVVVLGAETTERGVVQVKDMVGGQSREVSLDELLADPGKVLQVKP
jgi:histidyl-tRNA synthetase